MPGRGLFSAYVLLNPGGDGGTLCYIFIFCRAEEGRADQHGALFFTPSAWGREAWPELRGGSGAASLLRRLCDSFPAVLSVGKSNDK